MKIILASASPRRRELLSQIGLTFEVRVSEVEEKITEREPEKIVRELATQKAKAVFRSLAEQEEESVLVIGADTVVACDGMILGKPADAGDAARMLRLLAGRSHEVYTGVCLLYRPRMSEPQESGQLRTDGDEQVASRIFHERTAVRFTPMTDEEIDAYVSTGDPLDKAGAYGIQGFCARYISGIEGDYNNVVGLPVGRLYQEAKEWLS